MAPFNYDRAVNRFDAQYEPEPNTGCWLWKGETNHNGYGIFKVNIHGAKYQSAHRSAWALFVGKIPDWMQIDHLCKVRACANPRHLEVVTCRENLLRGDTFQAKNANKTHCDNGHAFDEENTHIRAGENSMVCRTCGNDRMRGYRQQAGGDPYWIKVKQDPERLKEIRQYKREWMRAKRASAKLGKP